MTDTGITTHDRTHDGPHTFTDWGLQRFSAPTPEQARVCTHPSGCKATEHRPWPSVAVAGATS